MHETNVAAPGRMTRLRGENVRVLDHARDGFAEELIDVEGKTGPIFFTAELWDQIGGSPGAVVTIMRCALAARSRQPAAIQDCVLFQVSLGDFVGHISLVFQTRTNKAHDDDETDVRFVVVGEGSDEFGDEMMYPTRARMAFSVAFQANPERFRIPDPAEAPTNDQPAPAAAPAKAAP